MPGLGRLENDERDLALGALLVGLAALVDADSHRPKALALLRGRLARKLLELVIRCPRVGRTPPENQYRFPGQKLLLQRHGQPQDDKRKV